MVAAAVFCACGGRTDFELPVAWQDAAREALIEQGLPAGIPEPGPRPLDFECTVETSIGMMTVSAEDPPSATGVLLIGAGGTVDWGVLPMPRDGIVSWDLADGTDVYLIGDLLVFDRASNRVTDPGCATN